MAQLAAAVVLLLSLLTLGEYALGADFGLDELLKQQPEAAGVSHPGRMSLATACNFTLLALALLTLDWKTRRGQCPAQALALLAALIGQLAFTGYLYGVQSLYAFSPFSTMAVHTALLFFGLSVGVLCARSAKGPLGILTSATVGGVMARRLLPVAVVVPLVLGWLRLEGQQRGFYGFEFGLALYATMNVFVFGFLIWLTAVWLNRAETRRQEMETQARQLAAIVEFSDDAIIGKDLQGIVTSWNAGAEKVFGYAAAEMAGQPIMRLIPPERQAEETDILGRIHRGESVRHFETVRVKKDGQLVDISVTVSPIKDDQGRVIGASKVARDITERRRAETRLRESLKEITDLKAALDEHAIVAITDQRGKITFVNDKFCAISQYAREELLGQDHRIINSGHHPKEFIRDLWTTIAQGRVWHGELKNKAKDGTFYWVDTTIVPFLNEQGKPRQYVAIRADITERKKIEEEIRELNAGLERRVGERTAELAAANKELEAFSYSVSHDLRAPLRAVDGFSQAVAEDYGTLLPDEGRRYLRTIRDSAQRMGALIDDLLAFSRLSRQPLNKQSVDTGKLVRNVLEELKSQFEGRKIEIRFGYLPASQGDPALLKQVWINLLSNALKYTRQRDPAVIEISCGPEQGTGVPVYFVRDNGTGFDMQYAHKLFGVFQRLHRAEDYEGTGVGLAIVQRIVHRHGGRVWADAALDHGATFFFTLEGEPQP